MTRTDARRSSILLATLAVLALAVGGSQSQAGRYMPKKTRFRPSPRACPPRRPTNRWSSPGTTLRTTPSLDM